MNQRTALILAASLSAFLIAIIGSVAATIAYKPASPTMNPAVAQTEPAQAPTVTARLSADQAVQIALNAVPGATLQKTPELVNFQGTVAFEVSLSQGVLYIDANDGRVLFNGAVATAPAPFGNDRERRQREGRSTEPFEGGRDD